MFSSLWQKYLSKMKKEDSFWFTISEASVSWEGKQAERTSSHCVSRKQEVGGSAGRARAR